MLRKVAILLVVLGSMMVAVSALAQCSGGVCGLRLPGRPVARLVAARPIRRLVAARPVRRLIAARPLRRVVGVVWNRRPGLIFRR